jgi:hypothetical protein
MKISFNVSHGIAAHPVKSHLVPNSAPHQPAPQFFQTARPRITRYSQNILANMQQLIMINVY